MENTCFAIRGTQFARETSQRPDKSYSFHDASLADVLLKTRAAKSAKFYVHCTLSVVIPRFPGQTMASVAIALEQHSKIWKVLSNNQSHHSCLLMSENNNAFAE